MNQLAYFIFGLINGNRPKGISVSEAEQAALADLEPILCQTPNALASWLVDGQTPAAEWLIPPPSVLERPCF